MGVLSSSSRRAGQGWELDLSRVWMLPSECIRGTLCREMGDVRGSACRRAAGVGGMEGWVTRDAGG